VTAPRAWLGRVARLAAAAAALALALAAGPARADDAAPAANAKPSAEAQATAERYFRAGAKAYAAQSFAAAAANFDEAYRALPLPEIAFSAAQAYRRLYRVDPRPSHVQRAVELYRVYLDKVKTGGRVGDAADSLGEMERELDKLKARGARIETAAVERTRLGINVSLGGQAPEAGAALREVGAALREVGDATGEALPGVKVAIDGKPVEPFALVDVAPGEHAISVAADGYFPIEKRQRALEGATALVEVELRPRPAQVAIRTLPGARIAVDGRAMPSPRLELAPGKHLIAVTHGGREPFAREVTVGRGEALVLTAPLARTGRRRAVPWVLAGAGALGLIATLAVTTALVEDNRAENLRAQIRAGDQPASAGDAYDGAIRRRDAAKTTAWVFGVGALAVGATAAALYFIETPAEAAPAEPVRRSASAARRARRIMLSPMASSTGGGVAALGRF
jgi:hypothetical protein